MVYYGTTLTFEEISPGFIEISNSQLCQTMPKSKKNGGPYSDGNKQKRRGEVYRLHFEYGYSARKIADTMKINRNTINADVKFWYKELGKSFEVDTIKGGIAKQLVRYETQVNRLTEKIESCDDIESQLNIEKLITDISNKASILHLKILDNHAEHPVKTKSQENEYIIDEKLIRHITLFLTLKYAKNPRLTEKSLKSEIINLENCTIQQDDSIYHYMYEIGLNHCSVMVSGFEYDLLSFALLRRYVHLGDSYAKCLMSLCMLYNAQPFEKSDLKKEFIKQHGKEEDWYDHTHEEYSKKLEDLKRKHTKASAEIFAQAFEELDYDEEKFYQYTKYIAVKFGESSGEKQLFEKMFDD
jgi:hypothetical protein